MGPAFPADHTPKSMGRRIVDASIPVHRGSLAEFHDTRARRAGQEDYVCSLYVLDHPKAGSAFTVPFSNVVAVGEIWNIKAARLYETTIQLTGFFQKSSNLSTNGLRTDGLKIDCYKVFVASAGTYVP